MRMQWISALGLMVRRLIFPPRCRVCGVLLPWGPYDGAARVGIDGLVSLFHGELFPVMCGTCREGAEEPSGCRCTVCEAPLFGDVLYPPLCGHGMDPNRPLSRITALFLHGGGPAMAVRALKYKNKRALAPPMGRLLFARALATHLDAEGKRWDIDLVVPVPLHGKRLRQRGFNQASLLLKAFEQEMGLRVCHRMLRRRRATPPQAGLTRKARLKNVKGAFEMTAGRDVKGKRVLLVDDVFTTGSTLAACAKILKKNGAIEVSALVFARRDMKP
jgi:ComF family protein